MRENAGLKPMGPEGFQFACITHPHYIRRVSFAGYPCFALPGLKIHGHGTAGQVVYLSKKGRTLRLNIAEYDASAIGFGFGLLAYPIRF